MRGKVRAVEETADVLRSLCGVWDEESVDELVPGSGLVIEAPLE